jgi:hypothetical protein
MNRKRFLVILAIVLIPVISFPISYYYPLLFPEAHKEKFIKKWSRHLGGISSEADIKFIPQLDGPDLVQFQDFQDGSWVAARQQTFAGRRDLSIVVMADNQKNLYVSEKEFGSQDEFKEAFWALEGGDAPDFIEAAKEKMDLRKME